MKTLSIIFIASIFIGCDYHNYWNFRVNNQTSKRIELSYKDRKNPDSLKSVIISSGEIKLISTHGVTSGKKGDARDLFTDSVYQFSLFQIKGYDTIVARKSFLRRSEWEYVKNGETGNYQLTIDSSDFQ